MRKAMQKQEMIDTIKRQLEEKKVQSELSRQQGLNFAKSVNERASHELVALNKKRDEKQQKMLEVQEYLSRQRSEQRERKIVLKRKMNEYEVGINKSLLEEAKMKTDLAQQL